MVRLKAINDKIDFSSFSELPLRKNEIVFPIIPLKTGAFTGTGFRFRKNVFTTLDYWLPMWPKQIITFYDLVLFNNDIY